MARASMIGTRAMDGAGGRERTGITRPVILKHSAPSLAFVCFDFFLTLRTP